MTPAEIRWMEERGVQVPKTTEELLLMVNRGTFPIMYDGDPPHCSNCGCSESMHNRGPTNWPGHKDCDKPDHGGGSRFCWGGFDLAPGGTNANTCTHRNGCKPWCTCRDEAIALDAEEAQQHDLAATIRRDAKARADAWRKQR